MKIFILPVVVLIFIFTASDIKSYGNLTHYFELEINKSNFNALKQSVGESGIRSGEMGRWIANNSQVSYSTDRPSVDNHQPETSMTILAVDENGFVIGSEVIQLKLASQQQPLNSVLQVNNLGNALTTIFNNEAYLPDDIFFPQKTYVNSHQEAQRYAVSAGSRAINAIQGRRTIANNNMELISGKFAAIIMMVTPDSDAGNYPTSVSPGIAVIVGQY